VCFRHFNYCGFDPRSLLRKELFPDLLESVIPECFYRESRRERNSLLRVVHCSYSLALFAPLREIIFFPNPEFSAAKPVLS